MIDPYKLAEKNQTISGEFELNQMPRVVEILAKDQGKLSYKLSFSLDQDKVCVIDGNIHTSVEQCCQRCMQNFCQDIDSAFRLSPVVSDLEAKKLVTYDPVIVVDGKLELRALLEDELILALPIVAMHAPKDCANKDAVTTKSDEFKQDLKKPFQVLQELKLRNVQKAEEKNGRTTKS